VMIYASVVAGLLLAFGVLAIDTARVRAGAPPAPGHLVVMGVAGSRGFHLAAWGMALVMLAAPIDDLWHRLFGLDVTIWSPPHLLGIFGSCVSTLGCLVVACEVYARGRMRTIAVVVGAALLYGTLRVTLDPAWLLAYTHGGVAFHAYALLAALLLPLALVPAAWLSGARTAPVLTVAVVIAIALAGAQVARAGFALLAPVSVLAEEVAKDPTSPIALAAEIAEKNRGVPDPWARRLVLPLIPALLMAAVDARRRPVAASVVYGAATLAVYGWFTASRPAFEPMIPAAAETVIALMATVAAALAGGAAARWLAALGEDLDSWPAAALPDANEASPG
jgi:hypothetical protein